MGCHFLLQGIVPIQGSNLSLLHCRQILYPVRPREAPLHVIRLQRASRSGGPTVHGVRPWVPTLSGSLTRSSLDSLLCGKGGCSDPFGPRITPPGLPEDPSKTASCVQGLSVPGKRMSPYAPGLEGGHSTISAGSAEMHHRKVPPNYAVIPSLHWHLLSEIRSTFLKVR